MRYMDSLLPLELLGLVLESLEMHDLLSCTLVSRAVIKGLTDTDHNLGGTGLSAIQFPH